jgi:hypothetical protein
MTHIVAQTQPSHTQLTTPATTPVHKHQPRSAAVTYGTLLQGASFIQQALLWEAVLRMIQSLVYATHPLRSL